MTWMSGFAPDIRLLHTPGRRFNVTKRTSKENVKTEDRMGMSANMDRSS
jgi:hypothetical protein